MRGMIGYMLITVGFFWVVETHLGFRIEAAKQLYPFDFVTRQLLGVAFLATGTISEWMKSRRSRREMLYYL